MKKKYSSRDSVRQSFDGTPVVLVMSHCRNMAFREIGPKNKSTQLIEIVVELDNEKFSRMEAMQVSRENAEEMLGEFDATKRHYEY